MVAYMQVRRGYHSKLDLQRRTHLNKRIEGFKGNGEKLFDFIYDTDILSII